MVDTCSSPSKKNLNNIGNFFIEDKNSLKQRIQRAALCRELIEKIGPAPEFIVLKGRFGSNNVINGLYCLGRESYNGRVYYEKCDFQNEAYIRWHKKGNFKIKNSFLILFK
jgi:hypothetical protein